MWRYIVGLLATVGVLTLIAVGGGIALIASNPFSAKPLPRSMVLSLDLRNVPAEAASSDLLRGSLFGSSRDIVEVVQLLWQAADDPRVIGMFVEIGDDQAGLARVQELRQAIANFRGKGKFAVGFAESLGGSGSHLGDYYLATALEQIWLQPSGGFAVTGIAVETPFLKGGLDKLGVQVEGGKRYEYKSAPDSFLETGYTRPARENLQQLLDSLFGEFITDVARDRRLEPAQVRRLVDSAPFDSEKAREEGLVDRIGYRGDALEEVWQRTGTVRDLISLSDYASDDARPKPHGDVVALVRVNGPIVSGPAGDGGLLDDDVMATAEGVVDALDEAARTKDVRAIVLRIDSPGGTYPAADAIADAVGRARATGKPVIVSMGDVAASGGYLAAIRADTIVAQPTTITASIGVFTIWPVASELLSSLGIKVDRISVGANAGMYSTFQPPTAAQRAIVARELDVIYREFTRQVGEARKLDSGRLDAAARGRVLSGVDAKRAGLVDELGGLQLALSIAKAKAGIDESRPVEIRRYPDEHDRWQRIFERLFGLAGVDAGPTVRAPREVREALARMGIVARPGNVRLPPLPPLWR
ncbi:MAG: signal peptide peptidase SppA [Reyranella sp.]|uniref:signal peptide peptidase SppA n=1 Tax=Reyranella sp. TaxID=1929291 RepID=UPI00272FE657|nr:signal peptide peptidase SppA [Reyranella sp.]MDP1962343.1 signal peptide peptidase SppA [Reyranella sp.]MDP2376526.1 signal peptide peptidase SppA [Reyranella sp.]